MQSSIIIPALNRRELTRGCLEALGATLPPGRCEVIVVDAASADETGMDCRSLGEGLFGADFRYLRSEVKLNSGAASNLGARASCGEFLIFLNNDTIPKPGWYEPLFKDFSLYPDIAATGPLLLYPPSTLLGETVQHLGVFVSPEMRCGHLYEAIPASSPLAKKRRFFQIITAACMVMPRKLFFEFGGFGERFVNGCEDVDLCARLWDAGYRMTVNPDSAVCRLTGRTPECHGHEAATMWHLEETSLKLLTPDWQIHLQNDGFKPGVTHWLFCCAEDPAQLKKLPPSSAWNGTQGKAAIVDLIKKFPFDQRLYPALAEVLEFEEDFAQAASVLAMGLKMRPEPETALALKRNAEKCGNTGLERHAAAALNAFAKPFHGYVNRAEEQRCWCAEIGLEELAGRYANWLDNKDRIFQEHYRPFMQRLRELRTEEERRAARNFPQTAGPLVRTRAGSHAGLTDARTGGISRPLVSVIIPSYNYARFLPYTLENVLAEKGVELDVIVVDDGSTDNTAEVAQSFGPAVRCIRQENQGASAARNTGLAHARGDFLVFLDADDFFFPGALLSQVETLNAIPDAHAVVCRNELFFGPEPAGPFSFISYFPLVKEDAAVHLCKYNIAPVHAYMIRAAAVRNVGLFDTSLRGEEDYDFWFRCAAAGCIFAINPNAYALYRRHRNNVSESAGHMHAQECLMREKVQRALKENQGFLADKRPDAWLAHACRCFDLAAGSTDNEKLMRQMSRMGAGALKAAAKEMAMPGNRWRRSAYSDNSIAVFTFLGVLFVEKLLAAGNREVDSSLEIYREILPEALLDKDGGELLYQRIYMMQFIKRTHALDYAAWSLKSLTD